jgi:YVTN family beta-propeller protein
MKLKSILFGTLCALMLAGTFAACDSDNNEPQPKIAFSENRAYILYEGDSKSNNAGIAFYAPDKDVEPGLVSDIYMVQNEKGLGNLATSIVEYKGKLYVVVSKSRLLVKLDKDGVEEASLSFTEADGDPRYVVAVNDKLYVTLWGGSVARVDAATMQVEASVAVGSNPEQLVAVGNKLYVANSGMGSGNTVSVVDLNSFTKDKDIEVLTNPNVMFVANDEPYVISWGYWGQPTLGGDYTLQRIDADDNVENVAVGQKCAVYRDLIYIQYLDVVRNMETWEIISGKHVYCTYNLRTNELVETPFIKNEAGTEALFDINTEVYAIDINPNHGDIYITTTDYVTTGDVYRFNSSGSFIEKFDCGGINPNKIIFPSNKTYFF